MSSRHRSLRQQTGQKMGLFGFGCNLVLFIAKIVIGVFSNSAAVIADGVNNLTDCASSIVAIIGFRFSSNKHDKKHPYGHGRLEYVSGFTISIIIILTAASLTQFAVSRILDPQVISTGFVLYTVLVVSIIAKLFMAYGYYIVNKTIRSATLMASLKDSLSDALVTLITILSLIVSPIMNIPIDGIVGLIVVGFVFWSGISSLLDNMSLLLGEKVDSTVTKRVKETILSYKSFVKIESVEMHDYGPESQIAIIKVRLASSVSVYELEDDIRSAKDELREEFRVNATIFWSPVQG
jgi:cation diffusion facilitator family transporter